MDSCRMPVHGEEPPSAVTTIFQKEGTTSVKAALVQQCAASEPPLRSELFSSDQMEQHGKTLAGLHALSPSPARDQLLARLEDNEGVLNETRILLTEAVTTDRRITPAG
jgi:hypothetical protein